MEIGLILKEAREAKNISLDSLQESTKIQKRYLIAIEEGNFDILPGAFYVKAFIKEYALAVGLDPNELFETYMDEIPSAEKDRTEYTPLRRSIRLNNPSRSTMSSSFMPTVIVVLLILGIIIIGLILYQKTISNSNLEKVEIDDNEIVRNVPEDEDTGIGGADEEEDIDEDDGEEGTNHTDQSSLELIETGTGNSPESTFELTSAPDNVKMVLTSRGNTWLDVKNQAGESLYSGELQPQASPLELDLSDAESVRLTIGYTPDLDIEINGEPLKYPIEPTERVMQKLLIHMNK